jgi:hypothetical protein
MYWERVAGRGFLSVSLMSPWLLPRLAAPPARTPHTCLARPRAEPANGIGTCGSHRMFLRWRTMVHRECSSSATGMPMPYGAQLIARARRIVLERGLLVRRLERKPVHALGVSSLFHFWGYACELARRVSCPYVSSTVPLLFSAMSVVRRALLTWRPCAEQVKSRQCCHS